LLLAGGDDQPGSHVTQAHVLVGDVGAADGLAAFAGGFVAFEGAIARRG
jgi:hypothetical protein